MTTFDPLKQLSTGAVMIHFDCASVTSMMVRLRHSKTDLAGRGLVLSAVCISQRVPPSVCPVHTLLATLQAGMAPLDAPLFINRCGILVVHSQVVKAIW